MDRFSRWPIAVPLPDTQTITVLHAFLFHWIANFGVPSTITTDRGAQFESHMFIGFLRLFGIKRTRTTAYHPASNGLVERFHRQLKASLMSYAHPDRWYENLALVLLGIRASPKPDIEGSPALLSMDVTCGYRMIFLRKTTVTSSPILLVFFPASRNLFKLWYPPLLELTIPALCLFHLH